MQRIIISRFVKPSPCHDCSERTPFCHGIGQCEFYTAWKAQKEAFDQAEQAKRRGRQTASDQRSEQVYRQLKKDHLPGRSKGWR